jgi:hypothetical protein
MAAETKADASLGGASPSSARRIYGLFIAGALLLLIAGIAGAAVYYNQIAPWRTTVLIVDGKPIAMDYFLKRVRMSGQEPLAVLQALSFEEIVKTISPEAPFNIEVSNAEIDRFIEEVARGGSASIAHDELSEWHRQQLNDTGLSDGEFRDLQRARLLIRHLRDKLAEGQPTVGEQVRLYMIARGSLEEAHAVKARLDGGADFHALADELNADPELRGRGGELGWYSRAGLAPELADIAFDKLSIGEVSDPVALAADTFVILKVAEKDPARMIGAGELETIRAATFQDWLAGRFREHKVEYHGFRNGYDSETDAWVKTQISRMNALAGAP